jgi:uncharacterized protein (TIGR02145 family)
MKNKFKEYSIAVLLLVFIIGCRKHEPILPDNPLNGKTTAVFNSSKNYGSVTDFDGNTYKTIKIGDQTWMAENLRVTHYRNGDGLPNIKDTTQWANQTEGAWCNYNNTEDLTAIATYGRLYNWFVTQNPGNIAPSGWRVADIIDWQILIDGLGGDTIASRHLKENGILNWDGPNDADNSSGFTALAGNWRYFKGGYPVAPSNYGAFWTLSIYSQLSAPFLYLYSRDANIYKGMNFKVIGYSIRCIKE